MTNANETWPDLPYAAWRDTAATLHLWTQIVGKIRLVQTPWLNHSWHCTLYVTPNGLTTWSIPYGDRTLELTFDFIRHVLVIASDDGASREVELPSSQCCGLLCSGYGRSVGAGTARTHP
jgi:hypothetical protein